MCNDLGDFTDVICKSNIHYSTVYHPMFWLGTIGKLCDRRLQ